MVGVSVRATCVRAGRHACKRACVRVYVRMLFGHTGITQTCTTMNNT